MLCSSWQVLSHSQLAFLCCHNSNPLALPVLLQAQKTPRIVESLSDTAIMFMGFFTLADAVGELNLQI